MWTHVNNGGGHANANIHSYIYIYFALILKLYVIATRFLLASLRYLPCWKYLFWKIISFLFIWLFLWIFFKKKGIILVNIWIGIKISTLLFVKAEVPFFTKRKHPKLIFSISLLYSCSRLIYIGSNWQNKVD